MAEDNTDPVWVIHTQNPLGTYVKHPKLTGRLLARPPFRFLHDVVTSFMKTTNLLSGLFRDEELDSSRASADKFSKARFLHKLINCVRCATGETLMVTSAAIIAGKDPEYTNELLVKLASLTKMSPAAVNEAVAKTIRIETANQTPPQDPAAQFDDCSSHESESECDTPPNKL